ncbi:MAG: adenine phosphoribosyltransferase [Sphingomonadaceae bacterium]|nr:adenine phosphoribosyltransferase [Sphingomonadaceae bacterium]
MTPEDLKGLIRSIPDYPKPGIVFRDITTLIGHGEGFAATIDCLAQRAASAKAQAIAGIEARGFIFGAAVAASLSIPFVPLRKPGKLPVPVLAMDYALEYGTDTLEIDPGGIADGQRIVLVDDLIATGGTANAAAELIRKAGGILEQALFVVDLPDLGGAGRLAANGMDVQSLMSFPGD